MPCATAVARSASVSGRESDGSSPLAMGTDYIDLYWMHVWDGVTPVEEIVQTLERAEYHVIGRLVSLTDAQKRELFAD